MMGSRKVLSRTHFLPSIVHESLLSAQTSNIQLKPRFFPKGLSLLATDVIKSYFERGSVEEAHILFDEMSDRDVVTWTAMISGYTSCNQYHRAWTMFCEMVKAGVEPNAFTMSSILKACKGMKALSCGTLVHGLSIKIGIKGSLYVNNALMDMYATCCNSMDNACMVFENINAKNAVSWTTLITGYTHRGDAYGGLGVFRRMLLEEAELSPFSFSIAVRACASIGSDIWGRQVWLYI
ncbi:hypothetical protein L6164_026566 [Bauhinia variegata]|uniref:Uncharacterized protein n=1 Tax=Bauhinia variegata TaxID=167791 RepID=A0ACB9LRG8_BAUVA|nr:hypothetical protein L6164_026566 [Bauhinia variegata]